MSTCQKNFLKTYKDVTKYFLKKASHDRPVFRATARVVVVVVVVVVVRSIVRSTLLSVISIVRRLSVCLSVCRHLSASMSEKVPGDPAINLPPFLLTFDMLTLKRYDNL